MVMSGQRESHWLVIRRCLAIVRRLQRGPATREDLLEAVYRSEGEGAYGLAKGRALKKRFENDLQRIRSNLYIKVGYNRKDKTYYIQDVWTPLLDLSNEDLATVAWLEETFDLESPHHDEVHHLTEQLRLFLAPHRRVDMERQRHLLKVRLSRRDEREIAEQVWLGLRRALSTGRRVELHYISATQADEQARRHVVDVYEPPFFEDGHFYIRGFCRYVVGSESRQKVGRYLDYRLDRVIEVTVLPNRIPPDPPKARRYDVAYWLSPVIARRGVSRPQWIDVKEVVQQADGAAIVHGTTASIFRARQFLMRYREHCRVLGGPELLRAMKETVRKMSQLYEDDT